MTTYAIGYANCHIDTDSSSPTFRECIGAGWWVAITTAGGPAYWPTIKQNIASYTDGYNYVLSIGLPGDQIYNYQASIYVYTFPPLHDIILPITQSVPVGGQITLTPACKDSSGRTFTCQELTWTSSDYGIAAVSNGVVVGVSAGSATIQGSVSGISAICVVTVTEIQGYNCSDCNTPVTNGQYPTSAQCQAACAWSMSVISPTGGEPWQAGTPHDITWATSGVAAGETVDIELLKSGTVIETIVYGTPNNGLYTWNISSTRVAGTDYKVKVTKVSGSTTRTQYSATTNNFTITNQSGGNGPCGQPICYTCSGTSCVQDNVNGTYTTCNPNPCSGRTSPPSGYNTSGIAILAGMIVLLMMFKYEK